MKQFLSQLDSKKLFVTCHTNNVPDSNLDKKNGEAAEDGISEMWNFLAEFVEFEMMMGSSSPAGRVTDE
jgi:hypothetical protein